MGGWGRGRGPDPRSRAVADSFLNSLAAEPATASTTWGAIVQMASSGEGLGKTVMKVVRVFN